MFRVINNYLNNDDFFKTIKIINSPKVNWFFNTNFLYKGIEQTKQISHVLLNDLIKSTSENRIETNPIAMSILQELLKELKATTVTKAQLKLISKSNDIADFPFTENNQDTLTAIMYLNKNNGYTYVEGMGKINSEENRVVIFPSNTHYFESSCTDNDYRALLVIEYSVD
tara:strand:- start:82 stop:591 length:510 start_codon:yes stop_codon:yes gene_type:complete